MEFPDLKEAEQERAQKLLDRKLEGELENCLGKYTDSYESSLEIMGRHLRNLKQDRVISHSGLDLDSSVERKGNQYLMGGGQEPIYNKP